MRKYLLAAFALLLAAAPCTVLLTGPARAGAPWSCTFTDPMGGCPPGGTGYDGYAPFADFNPVMNWGSPYVAGDEWNPQPGQVQTVSANSPGDWQVQEYIPPGVNPGNAVTTYPDAGMQLSDPPITNYGDITSSFADTIPAPGHGDVGWQGYDNWFNNWVDEVMIQTQWVGIGPCDYSAVQQFGGSNGVPVQTWGLCDFGDPGGGGEKIWKLAPPGTQVGGNATMNEDHGSVDVTAMTDWLVTHGHMRNSTPATTTITALSAGFEISNTAASGSTYTYTELSFVNNTGTSPSPTPTPTSTSPSPSPTPTSTSPSPSPTPTSPSPTPTSPSPTPTSTSPSPPAGVLLGDTSTETLNDSNQPGQAEAFRYAAQQSGTAASASFYLDSSSTAGKVTAGIYSDAGGHPGTLLTQATNTSLHAGAWNTVTLPAVPVTAGTRYWIALLQPAGDTGGIEFRDVQTGGTTSWNSAQTSLTTLPGTWSDGPSWSSGPASAYVSG